MKYLKEYIMQEILFSNKQMGFETRQELIRCKDCIHHHIDNDGCQYCDRVDYGYGWKDEDFCSKAEAVKCE